MYVTLIFLRQLVECGTRTKKKIEIVSYLMSLYRKKYGFIECILMNTGIQIHLVFIFLDLKFH